MAQLSPGSATPAVPGDRNVVIDAARALAVCVVVCFHVSLFRVEFGARGMHIVLGSPGPLGWKLSWWVQLMPVFFLTGGYAHAVVLGRGRTPAQFLTQRVRRFLGPVSTWLLVLLPVFTAACWSPIGGAAILVGENLAKVLWFLVVYLALTVAAPWLVAAQARWGAVLIGGFALGALAVDRVALTLAPSDVVLADRVWHLNLLFVWFFCHQLGVAYAQGWWRRWPAAVAVVTLVASVVALPLLIRLADLPAPAVGFGDHPTSNLLPPTVAMCVLAVAQISVVALVDRRQPRWLSSALMQRVFATVNALLMTVYLWHVTIASIGMALWGLAARSLGITSWWASVPAQLAIGLPLIAVIVPLIARADLALIPGSDADGIPSWSRAAVAALLLTAGLGLIWRNGLALHGSAPWVYAGVALVMAARVWVQTAMAGTPQGHRPSSR